jgi:hypothetical protein
MGPPGIQESREEGHWSVMPNHEALRCASPPASDLPDPAREALDEPHPNADELRTEIGDSEDWDEASEEERTDTPP